MKQSQSLRIKKRLGIGLIEALVAIIVFTIGLVGVSKMIGNSLKSTQSSESQANISILADDLFERFFMLNASGGSSSIDESNIAKNSFLDGSSCASFSDDVSKNRCAVGQASRQEWNGQLSKLLGNDLISVNVCRKDSASSTCGSYTDNTKFIFVDIQWKQKIIGKAKDTNTSVTGRYVTQVSM